MAIPALSLGLLAMSVPAFAATPSNTVTVPHGYSVSAFGKGGTSTNPDDIARLGNYVYIAYSNGVDSTGKPSPKGITSSTIVEYDLSGNKINSWDVTGKCDGLAADPANNRILASMNEDGNSSFYVINPGANQAKHYTYSTAPAGGTDAITVQYGNIYISSSHTK